MSSGINNTVKNEETVQMIMEYGSVIRELEDAAEQLHKVWNEDSGERVLGRTRCLIDEMKDNYEGLLKWIGSGL